jgi:hypothetical protein
MLKLYWKNGKFNIQDNLIPFIEYDHLYALRKDANRLRIVSFLQQCDFQLIDYFFCQNGEIKVVKSLNCCIPLEDEGTGFNILFHLLGYILTGKELKIVENSIKPHLHPNL